MALFSRLDTLSAMKQIGMVAVFYHPDPAVSKKILSACSGAGASVVEFTNRGDGAVNVFSELAAYRRNERPDVILGVGSIIDAPTAALYHQQRGGLRGRAGPRRRNGAGLQRA